MHGTPSRVLLSRETTQRCACQRWRQWTNRAARPTWVVLFFGLILPSQLGLPLGSGGQPRLTTLSSRRPFNALTGLSRDIEPGAPGRRIGAARRGSRARCRYTLMSRTRWSNRRRLGCACVPGRCCTKMLPESTSALCCIPGEPVRNLSVNSSIFPLQSYLTTCIAHYFAPLLPICSAHSMLAYSPCASPQENQ